MFQVLSIGQKKRVMCLPQVTTLKERIEQEKGKDGFPVAGLKLIYAGMLQAFSITFNLNPSMLVFFFSLCI